MGMVDEPINNGWIDVDDELPISDEYVMVWLCKFRIPSNVGDYIFAWWDGSSWENDKYDDIEINPDHWKVSHWQNIPDRPFSKTEIRKLKIDKLCSKQKK